jgi:hypothetical protein
MQAHNGGGISNRPSAPPGTPVYPAPPPAVAMATAVPQQQYQQQQQQGYAQAQVVHAQPTNGGDRKY